MSPISWTDDQAELEFAAPVLATPTRAIAGMVRGDDPMTSQRAAVDIREARSALQKAILAVLREKGPLTAREVEELPQFAGFGASTCRKRISELKELGRVVAVGRKDKMALWSIV